MKMYVNENTKNDRCLVVSIKRNKLKKRIKGIKTNNDLIIVKLIDSGVLDRSIRRIDNKKADANGSPVLSEDYLESYNHYIHILDNFIDYFYDYFKCNIDSMYDILWAILKGNDDIFLDKKYLHDNDNIKHYRTAYDNIIVGNFYYNISAFREELKDDIDDLPINIDKIDINNSDDIEKLLDVLVDIYTYNKDKHIVLSLFNRVDDSTYKYYLNNFEFMLYTYFNKRGNN